MLEGTKAFTVLVIGICPESVSTSPGNVKAFVPFGIIIIIMFIDCKWVEM